MAKKNGKDKKDKKKTAAPKASGAKKKAAAPAKAGKKAAPAKKVAAAKPAKKPAAKKPLLKRLVEKVVKTAKPAAKKPEKEAKTKAAPVPKPEKPGKRSKAEAAPAAPTVSAETERDEDGLEAAEAESEEEVVLTDAEGRRYCRVKDCDQLASVDGYCRYHYLLFWKKIQVRKKILSEGKLERYIEELTARYPDKFLDMLRKDLRSEKEFLSAIQELEIDESAVDNEFEDETQTYIDEVRGMGEGGAREEEDF